MAHPAPSSARAALHVSVEAEWRYWVHTITTGIPVHDSEMGEDHICVASRMPQAAAAHLSFKESMNECCSEVCLLYTDQVRLQVYDLLPLSREITTRTTDKHCPVATTAAGRTHRRHYCAVQYYIVRTVAQNGKRAHKVFCFP